MKTIKTLASLAVMLMLFAGLSHGQTALSKTALTNAVSATDTTWTVTSTSGMVAPTLGQNGTLLYIDQEPVSVVSVTSATAVVVSRQIRTTTHAAAARIWFGDRSLFYGNDPSGNCTLASTKVAPWINIQEGRKWVCAATGNLTTAMWVSADMEANVIVETRAATGTQRAITGEFTTAATMTSGNLVGVRGSIIIPAAGAISGSYLYGTQGKVTTGTGTFSGTALAGVYGQLDVTGGTLSAGNNAAVQANIYGANSGTWANLNGVYIESAGGGVINSFIRMFGKSTYVFDIETNVHTQASSTCTPSAVTGATGGLKVLVDNVVRWIPLAATCP